MLGQLVEMQLSQLDTNRIGIDAGGVDGNDLVSLDDAQQLLGKPLDVVGEHIGVAIDGGPC